MSLYRQQPVEPVEHEALARVHERLRRLEDGDLQVRPPRKVEYLVDLASLLGGQHRLQTLDVRAFAGAVELDVRLGPAFPRGTEVGGDRQHEEENEAHEEIEADRRRVARTAIARELRGQLSRPQEHELHGTQEARVEFEGLPNELSEHEGQRADVVPVVLTAARAIAIGPRVAAVRTVRERLASGCPVPGGERLASGCPVPGGLRSPALTPLAAGRHVLPAASPAFSSASSRVLLARVMTYW